MRSNLRPALVLQAFALAVVCGYFWSPGVKAALDVIGDLKVRFGYVYSALATCLFGGLVPYAVLSLGGRIPRKRRGAERGNRRRTLARTKGRSQGRYGENR